MNAKDFLAKKGVHNLDTKKRYNEVIAWMEEYAALRQLPVVGRSEQLRAFKQFLQSEYQLPISNRMVDEFEQKQSS